jgi:hypothetical protein
MSDESNKIADRISENTPWLDLAEELFNITKDILKKSAISREGSKLSKSFEIPIFPGLQTFAGIAEIVSASGKYNDDMESVAVWVTNMELLSGVVNSLAGVGRILETIPPAVELTPVLTKAVPYLNIASGLAQSQIAIAELVRGDQEWYETTGSILDLLSGLTSITSGVLAKTPFVAPLSVLSITFSLAAMFFNNGNWGLGILTLGIGSAISIKLFLAVKAMMKGIMIALTAKSAAVAVKLALTIVGIAAGLAVLAAVGVLIYNANKSAPPMSAMPMPGPDRFAQGGFPITGHSFIARETGPELVGTLNGRTAVINNDQIVEGVRMGVSRAVTDALQGNDPETTVKVNLLLDGKVIASDVAHGNWNGELLINGELVKVC